MCSRRHYSINTWLHPETHLDSAGILHHLSCCLNQTSYCAGFSQHIRGRAATFHCYAQLISCQEFLPRSLSVTSGNKYNSLFLQRLMFCSQYGTFQATVCVCVLCCSKACHSFQMKQSRVLKQMQKLSVEMMLVLLLLPGGEDIGADLFVHVQN